MQRATKIAFLVAVASTTLTTTTGFADTTAQNTPNTTTPTSVADSATSEPSTTSIRTSQAVGDPLFIPMPSPSVDSVAPSAALSSASETDLTISLPDILPGEKSLLTSAATSASSAANALAEAGMTELITDISIVGSGAQPTKPAADVVESVGSDATTPSEETSNKVQVSTDETQPVAPARNATNISETTGDVVKTNIHVVPAQQTAVDATVANAPSIKTPLSIDKNIAPDDGKQSINVVQTVAVKASNLADDLLPKAAYQFAWTPIAFVVVVITIIAWAVAYYTILRRQKQREYQILMRH